MQKRTIEVLKNFSTIAPMISIKQGNVLRTRSLGNEVYAVATVDDEFPKDVRMYALPEFLSTLSLFTDPEITYEDDHLKIISGNSSVKYKYSNARTVKDVSDKVPQLPDSMYKFVLEKEAIEQIMKASAVMKLNELVISDEGVKVCNLDNVGNECVISIPEMECDEQTQSMVLDIKSLKLMPYSYNVQVSARGAALFTSTDGSLLYFVALRAL